MIVAKRFKLAGIIFRKWGHPEP